MLISAAFISSLLSVLIYRWVNPGLTLLMVNKHLESFKQGKESKIRKDWVKFEKISASMVLAAISAEDNQFMEHWGFDFKSIKSAMKSNKKGRRIKGASTITQQTAKNLCLWPKRSWIRKGFEVYFTLAIEVLWSKKRIIEVYLNIAEFGKGIYGVEIASQKYFKKPAISLNKYQSSMLSTVLPNPTKRNPVKPSSYMYRYQQRILRNMANNKSVDFNDAILKNGKKETK